MITDYINTLCRDRDLLKNDSEVVIRARPHKERIHSLEVWVEGDQGGYPYIRIFPLTPRTRV